MNTPKVVIELSGSAVKIVVGYAHHNKPIVLYATTFMNQGLIERGEIVDVKGLATHLKNHITIEDEAARTRFSISQATLVLPPTGLIVYEDTKRTSVTSNVKQISRIDITNVINMMCNNKQDPGAYLLDIVPLLYYVNNLNNKTDKSPIGYLSTSLAIKALIYTLPRRIVESYKMALSLAGIRLQKITLAPIGIASLLAQEKDFPPVYIYVDIGADLTSISLISKRNVFASTSFEMGGRLLTHDIANAFSIKLEEAEKLKRRYGYTTRKLSFNPVVIETPNEAGETETYHLSDLNELMKAYLDRYLEALSKNIDHLMAGYPEDKRQYPIIVGGGASRLAGLLDAFKALRNKDDIRAVPLTVVGVRHQKYLNAVGALLADDNNPDVLQYNLAKNPNTSRTSALDKKMKS
ncbi:MAG: hypothetical protein MJ207_04200 [Bacilli bacterium]|nr:hypothetical protein [Bacilli bacterium]